MAGGRVAGLLELSDARTRLRLDPARGAAVAGMAARLPGGDETPILQPWGDSRAGAFGGGMILLVPFSNRISGGGFVTGEGADRAFHAIASNLAGEAFPIHGDGFQRPWAVAEATATRARLELEGGRIGPFAYHAEVEYALEDGALHATLVMTNDGPVLPFGGGFHPWLPRRPGTRLRFAADRVWLEDARHLPTEEVPVAERPGWDFADGVPLPPDWINNAFTGWKGRAWIEQPEGGIVVEVAAGDGLDTVILYAPDPDTGFFCLEPISHPVDAHNLPGWPGLCVLEPGASLILQMRLAWAQMGTP